MSTSSDNRKSRKCRPFVLVNMAMTADGKIATTHGSSSSFGSQRDKARMFELRSTVDAVMAGARTVDSDVVTMGPGQASYRRQRIHRGLSEYNLRVIVSRRGTIDPGAEIFRHRFSPIIILTTERAPARRLDALRRRAEVRVCGEREVDFASALQWLRSEWGVKRLLCEGGGELNDTLLRAGLVDEFNLTICPLIFGGRHAPTISEGTGVPLLGLATLLDHYEHRRVGDELFLRFRVRPFAANATQHPEPTTTEDRKAD
jgi:riboflavin-specific deaminase-like protein